MTVCCPRGRGVGKGPARDKCPKVVEVVLKLSKKCQKGVANLLQSDPKVVTKSSQSCLLVVSSGA